MGVRERAFAKANVYSGLRLISRNRSELAFSDIGRSFRPFASVWRFFWRDGTRNGTRPDRLRGDHAENCSRGRWCVQATLVPFLPDERLEPLQKEQRLRAFRNVQQESLSVGGDVVRREGLAADVVQWNSEQPARPSRNNR